MHAMIFSLGNEYVSRGELTLDEYDNFKVLYDPYAELGGNGTGKKLMQEIDKLKITDEWGSSQWPQSPSNVLGGRKKTFFISV